jgi:putative chitinase
MSKINRKFFFSHARSTLFGGALAQSQVEGLSAILDYWEEKHAKNDDRWLAYILATAFHETDQKMQPIHEYGSVKYFDERYGPPPVGKNPSLAKQLGNTQQGDGARFHGRGYVQLTGRTNYADWKKRLGIDLIGNPDLAATANAATKILLEGSILGTFTGKKLSNYFAPGKEDWVGARRIINGTDKANNIAGYGLKFYAAISYTV